MLNVPSAYIVNVQAVMLTAGFTAFFCVHGLPVRIPHHVPVEKALMAPRAPCAQKEDEV